MPVYNADKCLLQWKMIFHTMSSEQVKLTDLMQKEFPSKLQDDGSQPLEAGVYHVTKFAIMDSEDFNKVLRLDTQEGKYRTTSKAVVGSFAQSVGNLINKALEAGASNVEVEIVRKKANTGRWGLGVKAFQ